jgi:hypothetical protein
MTQEDKELLLKDLCARLPYETLVYAQNAYDWYDDEISTQVLSDAINEDYVIKPYLFPLSSITEKQKKDLLIHVLGKKDCKHFQVLPDGSIDSTDSNNFRWVNFDSDTTSAYIDWCNKNHIDYRNLIGKNLALDATGLNIY